MQPDRPRRVPEVLKKFDSKSLLAIERGILGDLPEKLQPRRPIQLDVIPTRDVSNKQAVVKQTSIGTFCIPIVPNSPDQDFVSLDEESPLKKSLSFREKFSRLSFFKDKNDKNKRKEDKHDVPNEVKRKEDKLYVQNIDSHNKHFSKDHDSRSSKKFWLFKHTDKKSPIYKRSKSFEFLPRALDEAPVISEPKKLPKNNRHSLIYASTDSMGDAWASNESLEFTTNDVFEPKKLELDNILEERVQEKETPTKVFHTFLPPKPHTPIIESDSMTNLLNEFDKAVEQFSENYQSDCEPYTKSEKLSVKEKRKSSSFSNLPTPKVIFCKKNVVNEVFQSELSSVLASRVESRSTRRGSVTDWKVLEGPSAAAMAAIDNKYKRKERKPINRVRRISSTKYWVTAEEYAVYSREQRPPLVIPRITQCRPQRQERRIIHTHEETIHESPPSLKSNRQYDRLQQEWSPASERSRMEIENSFGKDNNSPPFGRVNKRIGGSTENLLNLRRPNHLHLPASSSGDSLDVELRNEPVHSRKAKSMVTAKDRIRSPVPAPRAYQQGGDIPIQGGLTPTGSPVVHSIIQAPAVHDGPMKRTKFTESGKKCKKHWTDCYAVLTPTALLCYKDQKTYQATRMPKPGTPPSPTTPRPEIVLALRNAHVLQCIQTHTRRYAKSLILTVSYDQYLFQDDSEDGIRLWFNCIHNVICSLVKPTSLDEYKPYQSSNTDLESLGRTPPVSRHPKTKQKAGGSSNEDLSDSTEASIQKSDVKSRLKKFFQRRPTVEMLMKKGIYKDEPVFGRQLEEVCPSSSPRVPEFVVACVKEIERNDENMCTDGLYRASGNLSQVQKIRLEIDQNNMMVLENYPDIHVLTGSLKLFFRELKEPLIPCRLFDRVLAACSIKPRESKIREFRDIMYALPQCNRDTLRFLLEHLLRVTKYSEHNRMHTANLAIVFGPTLLWAPAEQAHNIAFDCIQQNNVVDILLTEFSEIFEEGRGKKKS